VEQFAAIRRDERVEGLSIRELAERHHVHRRTVRQALANALPPERKTPVRVSRRLEVFKPAIDAMLRADLDAPRKQRHTARRVLARLVDEYQAVEVSYSTVRDYIARRRPEIAIGGRAGGGGRVRPQTHPAGAEGEVDFAVSTRAGVTEQAALAAIGGGCRTLRPTMRSRFAEIAAAAEREQLSYLGFLAELVMAECDDRDTRRAAPAPRSGRVPRGQAGRRVRLRRQPHCHGCRDQPARNLRKGEERAAALPHRGLPAPAKRIC
jgi:DNA-binding transcriptional regulator YhcF (GntR family)